MTLLGMLSLLILLRDVSHMYNFDEGSVFEEKQVTLKNKFRMHFVKPPHLLLLVMDSHLKINKTSL